MHRKNHEWKEEDLGWTWLTILTTQVHCLLEGRWTSVVVLCLPCRLLWGSWSGALTPFPETAMRQLSASLVMWTCPRSQLFAPTSAWASLRDPRGQAPSLPPLQHPRKLRSGKMLSKKKNRRLQHFYFFLSMTQISPMHIKQDLSYWIMEQVIRIFWQLKTFFSKYGISKKLLRAIHR